RAELSELRCGPRHYVLVAIGARRRIVFRPQSKRTYGPTGGMLALKLKLIKGECIAWGLDDSVAHALRAGIVTQSRRIKAPGSFGCVLLGDECNTDRDHPQRDEKNCHLPAH